MRTPNERKELTDVCQANFREGIVSIEEEHDFAEVPFWPPDECYLEIKGEKPVKDLVKFQEA